MIRAITSNDLLETRRMSYTVDSLRFKRPNSLAFRGSVLGMNLKICGIQNKIDSAFTGKLSKIK